MKRKKYDLARESLGCVALPFRFLSTVKPCSSTTLYCSRAEESYEQQQQHKEDKLDVAQFFGWAAVCRTEEAASSNTDSRRNAARRRAVFNDRTLWLIACVPILDCVVTSETKQCGVASARTVWTVVGTLYLSSS